MVLADDPVAGDDDGNRVAVVSPAYGPESLRLSDGPSQVAVGADCAVGDFGKLGPDFLLERGAA